jgi:type II secretory pathway component PulJ
MKPNQPDVGFTVVEILVALSIIGLVAVTLISTLDYGRNALTAIQSDGHRLEQIALLRRVLAEALAQVTPAASARAPISGNDRTLIVMTSAPRLLSFLNSPVRFALGPGAGGDGLSASWDADSNPNSVDHRIVSSDYSVRFSYLAAEAAWTHVWADQTRAPSAIRAELRRAQGIGKGVELIFPVRVLASSVCAVEPRAAPCRAAR